MKIAYITAGAAGMYCGSCMHDNTLARALIALGHDVALVPLYTPIRTDEQDISARRVFFGGINVYLQQKSALFRRLPRWTDRWLDMPWLIRLATGFGISIEAKALGALAVSMLQGSEGRQAKEVDELAKWLAEDFQPDVVNFSNMLMAGSMPQIKRRRDVPVVVTLQGDDIFLRDLIEPYKTQAFAEIRRLDASVAMYLVNSEYYADFMAEYMSLSRAKFAVVPLGIDTRDFEQIKPEAAERRPPTVGYLARLAPEKGLHILVGAFELLKKHPGLERARLHIAGWLGPQHRGYANEQFDKLRKAGYGDDFQYFGEVTREQKLEFLAGLDVLSVPTTYREPKGLFVLEALASGVPVVQPAHGAFPEMLAAVGGGRLVPPEDPVRLAEELASLLTNQEERKELAAKGRAAVFATRSQRVMAERTSEVLERIIPRRRG